VNSETAHVSTLRLVRESKIGDLLPDDAGDEDWEASGVLAKDGSYYVVFDNRATVARLAEDLLPSDANRLVGSGRAWVGYEGIAYNAHKDRFYLLVESRKDRDGQYYAEVHEADGAFRYTKKRTLDFAFARGNKGFEAIAWVRRDERDIALALCEGNKCQGGKKGRILGGGRVQIFEKTKKLWQHIGTLKLPTAVPFTDYSAMSVNDHRVAIASQEKSMLWVGVFDESNWTWRDAGELYEFPRAADGSVLYGNVEGVAWIAATQVVAVSDRHKKGTHPDQFAQKDQSIHIFDLPI
jgi:hypothetical protein